MVCNLFCDSSINLLSTLDKNVEETSYHLNILMKIIDNEKVLANELQWRIPKNNVSLTDRICSKNAQVIHYRKKFVKKNGVIARIYSGTVNLVSVWEAGLVDSYALVFCLAQTCSQKANIRRGPLWSWGWRKISDCFSLSAEHRQHHECCLNHKMTSSCYMLASVNDSCSLFQSQAVALLHDS